MGEGWGEGEYNVISATYVPLPFIPSHKGRGNPTFYEFVKFEHFAKVSLFSDASGRMYIFEIDWHNFYHVYTTESNYLLDRFNNIY